MKKLFLIAMTSMIVITSCSSKQKKAESLVTSFVEKKLNDPKSYESVSFSPLTLMKDTIMKSDSGTVDTVFYDGRYEISHTYRAKNAIGGVLTTTEIFQVDSSLTEAKCCFMAQHNLKSN